MFLSLCFLGCSPLHTPSGVSLIPESRVVISEAPGPLAPDAPIPVLSPPQTFAVWVPSHVDRRRDLLVGEHWLFLKLTESEWYPERAAAESDPPATAEALPADLAPLRTLSGFERAVVPYREVK